jgi:hypothetical protein
MTTTTSPRTATRSVWRAGLVTAAVAAVLTTLVWLVGQLSPATWQVTQGDQTREVLAFMPALASIMGVAVGTVSLWVLSWFPWGRTVWTVLAVLVGTGSVVSPLTGAEDAWTGALLAVMHLVVLGVALVLLRPAGRRRS